jgi:DNA (cytosine-5)-methyltransferase 1
MNFGLIPFGDIRTITRTSDGTPNLKAIRNRIPQADVIAAGFPCQPFSLAGVSSRLHHGLEHGLACDAQGTLFEDIILIAKALRPKVLLLENVRNLASHDAGRTISVIQDEIAKAGYDIFPEETDKRRTWAVIDSQAVVGQRRKRVYFLCVRRDIVASSGPFIFPEFHLPTKPYTLASVLKSDDSMSNAEKFEHFSISQRLWRSHKARDTRHRAKQNGFSVNLMQDLKQPAPTLVSRYYKDGKDCLIPNLRNPTRPPRMLTPRECGLLQTFPKTFWIHPAKSCAYRHFGNSITVEVARRVARSLAQYLSEFGPRTK